MKKIKQDQQKYDDRIPKSKYENNRLKMQKPEGRGDRGIHQEQQEQLQKNSNSQKKECLLGDKLRRARFKEDKDQPKTLKPKSKTHHKKTEKRDSAEYFDREND